MSEASVPASLRVSCGVRIRSAGIASETFPAVTAPSDPDDDVRLMEAVKAGEASALERLWERHAAAVLGTCRRILADASEAEEVALDVFVQAWEQGGRYDPGRASPRAWLLMMARSRAIDRARAAGRRRQLTLAPDDERLLAGLEQRASGQRHDPAAALAIGERGALVRTALAELPPEQREAVELAFLEGFSHREIAERLGAPLGTVKTRIRQALLRLRDRIRGDGRFDA